MRTLIHVSELIEGQLVIGGRSESSTGKLRVQKAVLGARLFKVKLSKVRRKSRHCAYDGAGRWRRYPYGYLGTCWRNILLASSVCPAGQSQRTIKIPIAINSIYATIFRRDPNFKARNRGNRFLPKADLHYKKFNQHGYPNYAPGH